MALGGCCTFETGDLAELYSTAGWCVVQQDVVRSGDYAGRITPVSNGVAYLVLGQYDSSGRNGSQTPLSEVWVGLGCYWAARPAASDEEFLAITDAGGDHKLALRMRSDGRLAVYDSAGTSLGVGATVLQTGRWYWVELLCGTGTDADYALRIDGVTELSGEGDLGMGGAVLIAIGKSADRNGGGYDLYVDDIVTDTADWPGDCRACRMDPDGDGHYTDWAGDYTDVDEVPHAADTDYITASESGAAETVTLEHPTAAGVQGLARAVKLVAVVRRGLAAATLRTRLRSGGTDLDGDDLPSVAWGPTYVAVQQMHSTDPATNAQWTLDGLADTEVGLVLTANAMARCTLLCAIVIWSPSPSPAEGTARQMYAYRQRRCG